jgi:hypothetical protein
MCLHVRFSKRVVEGAAFNDGLFVFACSCSCRMWSRARSNMQRWKLRRWIVPVPIPFGWSELVSGSPAFCFPPIAFVLVLWRVHPLRLMYSPRCFLTSSSEYRCPGPVTAPCNMNGMCNYDVKASPQDAELPANCSCSQAFKVLQLPRSLRLHLSRTPFFKS